MYEGLLSDEQWASIEHLFPIEFGTRRGRPYSQPHRTTIEGILYVIKEGIRWRLLPECYGNWKSVHKRFRRWTEAGIFQTIFETLSSMLDLDIIMVDGTFIDVHKYATGARRDGRSRAASREHNAIGKTKGGLTTMLVAVVDKNGRFVRHILQPGNHFELRNVEPLIDGIQANEFIADGLYDTNRLRAFLAHRGIKATIPLRPRRKVKFEFDRHSYMGRHLVENIYSDIRDFRGIHTRYCKLAEMFRASLDLVAWYLGTKEQRRGASPFHRTQGPQMA